MIHRNCFNDYFCSFTDLIHIWAGIWLFLILDFQSFRSDSKDSGWYYVMARKNTGGNLVTDLTDSIRGWKDHWCYIGGEWQCPITRDELDSAVPTNYKHLRPVPSYHSKELDQKLLQALQVSRFLRSYKYLIMEENLFQAGLSLAQSANSIPPNPNYHPRPKKRMAGGRSELVRAKKQRVESGSGPQIGSSTLPPRQPVIIAGDSDLAPIDPTRQYLTPSDVALDETSNKAALDIDSRPPRLHDPHSPVDLIEDLDQSYFGDHTRRSTEMSEARGKLPDLLINVHKSQSPGQDALSVIPESIKNSFDVLSRGWTKRDETIASGVDLWTLPSAAAAYAGMTQNYLSHVRVKAREMTDHNTELIASLVRERDRNTALDTERRDMAAKYSSLRRELSGELERAKSDNDELKNQFEALNARVEEEKRLRLVAEDLAAARATELLSVKERAVAEYKDSAAYEVDHMDTYIMALEKLLKTVPEIDPNFDTSSLVASLDELKAEQAEATKSL